MHRQILLTAILINYNTVALKVTPSERAYRILESIFPNDSRLLRSLRLWVELLVDF